MARGRIPTRSSRAGAHPAAAGPSRRARSSRRSERHLRAALATLGGALVRGLPRGRERLLEQATERARCLRAGALANAEGPVDAVLRAARETRHEEREDREDDADGDDSADDHSGLPPVGCLPLLLMP